MGDSVYDERVVIAAISRAKTGVTTELGRYKGFTLSVEKNFMGEETSNEWCEAVTDEIYNKLD